MKKFLFLLVIAFLAIYFLNSGGLSQIKSFWNAVDISSNGYYSFKSDILNHMAVSKGEKGEIEESDNLFKKSKKAAFKITDIGKRAEKIINIAEKRMETNKELMKEAIIQDTEDAVKEIAKTKGTVSVGVKNEVFSKVAKIQLSLGDPDALKKTMEEISASPDAPLFLFNLAKIYSEQGKIDSAMETIDMIPDKYYKAAAALTLMQNILSRNNKEEIAKFRSKFKKDDFLKKISLMETISFQIKKGDVEGAVKSLKEFEKGI